MKADLSCYLRCMAVVLVDISSLQIHRTPPAARDPNLCPELPEATTHALLPSASRRNAPASARALLPHLATALAGVTAPFHIIDIEGRRTHAPHIALHEIEPPAKNELIPIAEEVYVLSPERTLFDLCRTNDPVAIAKLMCEFCGLYSISPDTRRLREIARQLPSAYSSSPTKLAAYYNSSGTPRSFVDTHGNPYSWEPCFQRNGSMSTLWKRPPLCSLDDLAAFSNGIGASMGIRAFRKALRLAVSGSGSPAETIAAILMGPNRRLGQEGLPSFLLNRRVPLSGLAREALRQNYCVVDISWPQGSTPMQCCVEIDGASFHDDSLIDPRTLRSVNKDSARRTALAHMGIDVVSIAWSQITDIDQWDATMDVIYRKLGITRPLPSPAFLRRRENLRQQLLLPDICNPSRHGSV